MRNTDYWLGKNKWELDTPCLTLDLDILEANLHRMQQFATAHGKNLRPHAKSHKCSRLAKRQKELGAIGICVAKVSEAVELVRQGLTGILVTSPLVTPTKVEHFVDCLEQDPTSMVVVDSEQGLSLLSKALQNRGIRCNVLLDLNVGMARTGTHPSNALRLAAKITESGFCSLRGIQAYMGEVQHIVDYNERRPQSLASLGMAQEVFDSLVAAGYKPDIFSASGTGSFAIDVEIPQLTEFQVGSYALMDAEYSPIEDESAQPLSHAFPPPLTLISRVINNQNEGYVTIDAGLKALYNHGAIPIVQRVENGGDGDYDYDWFGDEFGKLVLPPQSSNPQCGSWVELVVSHCDPTVNLFDVFFVTQNDVVVDIWDINLRGKSQ